MSQPEDQAEKLVKMGVCIQKLKEAGASTKNRASNVALLQEFEELAKSADAKFTKAEAEVAAALGISKAMLKTRTA